MIPNIKCMGSTPEQETLPSFLRTVWFQWFQEWIWLDLSNLIKNQNILCLCLLVFRNSLWNNKKHPILTDVYPKFVCCGSTMVAGEVSLSLECQDRQQRGTSCGDLNLLIRRSVDAVCGHVCVQGLCHDKLSTGYGSCLAHRLHKAQCSIYTTGSIVSDVDGSFIFSKIV